MPTGTAAESTMLPIALALVDDDQECAEFLSQDLRQLGGGNVDLFTNSNDLLDEIKASG